VLKNDATLINYNRNLPERFQHIQVIQGKQLTEVGELHAGDIGAIAKLKETTTGETLGDKASPIYYSPAQLPEPSITFAIEPKPAADEDKIGVSIHKILEEDPALRFSRDPQTKEFLLAGSGQQHIEVVVAKLHKRYHVDLTLKPPKVPYREPSAAKPTSKASTRTVRRSRPVWRLPHQDGAGRARQGRRIRRRCLWRRHPEELDSLRRKRNSRRCCARLPRRFSGRGFPRHPYDGKYHDVDSSIWPSRLPARWLSRKP